MTFRPPASLPEEWKRVRLVAVCPDGWKHTPALAEVIEGLRLSLNALGALTDIAYNRPIAPGGRNIYFFAHMLASAQDLPGNCVIFNAEQMNSQILARRDEYGEYLKLMQRFPVWDYSERNAERCRAICPAGRVIVMPIGHVPQLARIQPAKRQDIDVLFYGFINERRATILSSLLASGLSVKILTGVYGAERDAWIARSKTVVNIHSHADKVHEIVRTSFLLENHKAVVTEIDEDTEIEDDIRAAVVGVPYDQLVRTCAEIARDDERRHQIEENGAAIFKHRDQKKYLYDAIVRTG